MLTLFLIVFSHFLPPFLISTWLLEKTRNSGDPDYVTIFYLNFAGAAALNYLRLEFEAVEAAGLVWQW